MEPRYICLITCACIIVVAVTLILIRYFRRNKTSKIKEELQNIQSNIATKIKEDFDAINESNED